MKLSNEVVASIKACEHVYTLADTARHFGVSKPTVHRLWTGESHTYVRAASDAPNIETTSFPSKDLAYDIAILKGRGYSQKEIALELNVSTKTVSRWGGE